MSPSNPNPLSVTDGAKGIEILDSNINPSVHAATSIVNEPDLNSDVPKFSAVSPVELTNLTLPKNTDSDSGHVTPLCHASSPATASEKEKEVSNENLPSPSVEIEDKTFMMRVVNQTLNNSQAYVTSADLSNTRIQPEYIIDDKGPPCPGIYTESAEDVKAVMEEKIASINATSCSNKAASLSKEGHMEYVEADVPLPPGAISISSPPNGNKKTNNISHNQTLYNRDAISNSKAVSVSPNDDKKSNDTSARTRPEYILDCEGPPPPDNDRVFADKTFLSNTKEPEFILDEGPPLAALLCPKAEKKADSALEAGQMEYIEADAPLPLNSSPSDDKKSTITSNERSTVLNIGTGSTEVDTDIEAQTITPRIAHVTGPERRKVLYDNSPIDLETTETNDVLTRESLLRYIPFHRLSRDTGEEADIRRKIFKLEVAVIGFVVVLMTAMVALAIFFAKSGANHVVVASEGSNTTSVAANPTFQEDVAAKPLPNSSLNENTLLDNYKFQICNPVEGDNVEFCAVGNCLTPQCSCEIYIREAESKNIIGFCNSCRICDFDGSMGFDCGNLGY
jgi:hypothetical protein